ncbi:MAG: hypothetical protein GY948_08730 [Alphaproteobacteria bacterium]|nr:hypothetical protein [Alphaproteobacteria bacterium]
MAHWVKFAIALVSAGLGLWTFMVLPGWWGAVSFVGVFFVGGTVAHVVFKKLAAPDQIREDLQARLLSD